MSRDAPRGRRRAAWIMALAYISRATPRVPWTCGKSVSITAGAMINSWRPRGYFRSDRANSTALPCFFSSARSDFSSDSLILRFVGAS